MSILASATPPIPNSHLSSVFSESSRDFAAKVPDGLLDTFAEIRTLEELEHAIKDLEARQADRKSLRYLSKIKPCLNALDEYSKTIEIFVNVKPEMAFVWGPIKVCLLIASKYDKAFDCLLSTYVKIKDALPHFSAIEHLFEDNLIVQNVLGNVYKDVLSFHLRALTFFMQKGWKIALRISCRTLEDMFGDVLSSLQRSKDMLYSSANIAHYQEAQQTRHQIQSMFRTQQEASRLQKRAAVRAWLNPSEHSERHDQLCDLRGRYPQTSKWIFREPCWKNWLDTEDKSGRILWASGIPGAGKTVIFSGMVEELASRSNADKSSAVAYLYCKYNDPQRNNFTELARSLIYQLAGNNDIFYDYLSDVLAKSVTRTATRREDLTEMIQDALQCYDEVFIGIDGLDECEQAERGMIIKLFRELLKLPVSTANFHIFVTSQAQLDIERFMALTPYHVKIEPKHLSDDIQCYVRERSAELARFNLAWLQVVELIGKISKRCAGMFLLARLIFDLFEHCTTRSDFEEEYAEKGLPRGIDEAYGRILSHIRKRDTESGRARAKLLLEVLSSAKQKLYVHELQGMLSMDTINHRMDFANRKYTLHFKELCGPLVEVGPDQTVELVHQTVREYLYQVHPEYVNLAAATFTSAKICLSYLALGCFQSTLEDQKMTEAVMKGDFAFYKYAILQLLPHINSLQKCSTQEPHINAEFGEYLEAICRNLQISPSSFSHRDADAELLEWSNLGPIAEDLEAFHRDIAQNGGKNLVPFMLRLKAYSKDTGETLSIFQQLARIQTFIERAVSSEKGQEMESFFKEAYGSRPYQCPSISCLRFHHGFPTSQERDNHLRGHEREFKCPFPECEFSSIGLSTQRSLDTHIDVFHVSTLLPQFSDLKPRSIWADLLDGIATNDEAVVEHLCIEAAKYPGKPEGLLGKAILRGFMNSVRALLRHFCGVEDFGIVPLENMGKFLVTLAKAGEMKMVRDIFNYSALRWDKWDFNRLLTVVLPEGEIDMCRFLLDQIELRGYSNWRMRDKQVLEMAAQNSNTDVLQLLLDKSGKDYSPTLLARCCTILAARGATPALSVVLPFFFQHFDATAGKMKGFKELKGLSVDEAAMRLNRDTGPRSKQGKGSSYGSAFQNAAFCGDVDRLSRILDLGIDINNISGPHGTALQAASKKGHTHVVQWLLERGAQIEIGGGLHGSPMAAASATGKVEVLRILLATGKSPSQEARATQGRFRLSLPHGPDAASPLHFAAAGLQEDAVRLLLEAGADITAKDSNGNTALHCSVLGPSVSALSTLYIWNKKAVTKRFRQLSSAIGTLLLDHGAIITAQNNDDDSPLHLLFIQKPYYEFKRPNFRDYHPCAIQMTKMFLKAGASLDTPNKKMVSAREAILRIGGELLEDLKREIPAAWEGLEESVGSGMTDVPSPSVEPLPSGLVEPLPGLVEPVPVLSNEPLSNVSMGYLIGPSSDQDGDHEARKDNLNDTNTTSNPRPMLEPTWIARDPFHVMYDPCPSTDLLQETGINPDLECINSEDQQNNQMNVTSNEVWQPDDVWNQPSNGFYQADPNLFMNPWVTEPGPSGTGMNR